MARGPRLDAPGALHHMRARGIEKRAIFHDDADREDFLSRLARLVEVGALVVYAWALMPNHVHLLVRTLLQPLHRSMRALLAGYATRFNRRHDRAGHLFQNRYKSNLCEDESYFLTLVRYIHRNPLPSVVDSFEELAAYPFSGHSALLGGSTRRWQDTESVLRLFSGDPDRARALYKRFVLDGNDERDRTALEGGGLIRRSVGWQQVGELRRGRERFTTSERILGGPRFVDSVLRELNGSTVPVIGLDELKTVVCQELRIAVDALSGNGRPRDVSQARGALAFLWTSHLGRSGRELALDLGLSPSSVYEAARRGATDAGRWQALIPRGR